MPGNCIFELSLHQCWSLGVSGNNDPRYPGAVGHDVVSEREKEGKEREGREKKDG